MVFIFSNSVLAKIIKFRITAIMLNRDVFPLNSELRMLYKISCYLPFKEGFIYGKVAINTFFTSSDVFGSTLSSLTASIIRLRTASFSGSEPLISCSF